MTSSGALIAGVASALGRAATAVEAVEDEVEAPGELDGVVVSGLGELGCDLGEVSVVLKRADRLISKGEVVVPMFDIANRDPDVFPDADEFCPHRNPNPHLGFGHGRHRCIGMAFARVQLQVGLQVMLSRLDGIALVPDSAINWRRTIFTRGVWNLPVTWRGGGQ